MSVEILARLKAPFKLGEVHWRVGATNAKRLGVKPRDATEGIALAYVNARDVMKRLDDVLGIECWSDEYAETASGRVICKLSICIDGQWITKSDGAGNTEMEGEKGAISDAFKRAAVKFGPARYLYYLKNTWCAIKDGKLINTPSLPEWALGNGFCNYSNLVQYNKLVSELLGSIVVIRQGISESHGGSLSSAAEAWFELSGDEQSGLWRAPTKGGIFTVKEREVLKSTEFKEAYYGSKES